MGNKYVIGDTHFGHEKSLTWLDDSGSKCRPFSSIEEMNNTIITNWNSVVTEQDTIYHLGDVVIKKQYLEIIKQLNGKKRLIRGNHDIFDIKEYLEVGFKEVYGMRIFTDLKVILSHIPIHPSCLKDGYINIHGHLHSGNLDDKRYVNVSVEQTNYFPITIDSILKRERA